MAEQEPNLSAAYEMRRQARGAEPPPRERRWLRRLLWISGSVLGVVLLSSAVWVWWSYTHVRAVSATLYADVLDLAPKISAPLAERYVREQDQVTEGQELLRLDDTELRAALDAARATLAVRQSQHAQAKLNLELLQATTAADLERAGAQARIATARCEQARAELARLEKGARPEDIEVARARLDSARALEQLRRLEVTQSEQLVAEKIDSAHVLAVKKTQLTVQENAVREADAELRRLLAGATEEEIEAARQLVAARQAELDDARAQVKLATARQRQVTLAEERVKEAADELKGAEEDVQNCQEELSKAHVVSSVNGTVTRIFPKVGEFCRQGEVAIKVADESKGFIINAYVREEDAPLVAVGQPAKVRVLAGRRRYVDAVVEQIGEHTQSQDSAVPTQSARPGQHELVWVKLRPKDYTELGDGLKHGMTARAIIKVR